MGVLLGALALIFGLVVSVALHEFGHMVPAKLFGVGVPQYSVGFGPSLVHRKWGQTTYHLRAIPLGGFVRIVGMIRPTPVVSNRGLIGSWGAKIANETRAQMRAELEENEGLAPMYLLAPWKKLVIMAGGIFMNLFLAIILTFVSLLGIGQPAPTTVVDSVTVCQSESSQCPAQKAGLQAGDKVLAVDGKSVASWNELVAQISAAPAGEPLQMTISRSGDAQVLQVVPYASAGRSLVGITPAFVQEKASVSEVAQTVWAQAKGTAGLVLRLPQATWVRISQMFGMQQDNRNVPVSVVGIVQMGASIGGTENPAVSVVDRIGMILLLLASLNMALFIFNLIPLLPLDGGHVVSAIFEWIRREWRRMRGKSDVGAADVARLIPLSYLVGGLLLLMTVILVVADFVAPIV
ncbi:M50 family metallopeptidase [Boudabousia marimammalium]|uniref:PDZ domain-containing protein n=1 Tax=Boudabousia marimammalium TaxID=156892 RepID=A0A1Q5PP62_9ACTO|nr:M50 family metallopeptidase [Boudabousia marimammalium]OKL49215.1 hypothetical protein BM477_04280 [Boudabousia marimammalium]